MRFLTVFCLVVIMFSCIKEREAVLTLSIVNDLSEDVSLTIYSFPETNVEPFTIILAPQKAYTQTRSSRGGSDEYPLSLQRPFPPGPSAAFAFRDTLVIHHLESGIVDTTGTPTISFEESRNVFNPENYVQEKVQDDAYRGTYYISNLDLAYAISVYE